VGLGYLRLGQNTSTLSGGEAQRLKLASYLADVGRANLHAKPAGASGANAGSRRTPRASLHALLIFNEPTVGLHMADVQVLMGVLQRLVDEGHSVLLVEHNLDVISQADWVIDLGPGGGEAGGELVAEGPPEALIACGRSVTGRFLGERFGRRERSARRLANEPG